MASISLRNVVIDFPIYQGGSRSLKKALLSAGTGGRISRDSTSRIVVRALNNISLDIEHGDRIGLIGTNGSGKTTLLRAMAGIYEPSSGMVTIDGRIQALFDINLGLNPDGTGYENILLRGLYMGLTPREIRAHIDEIVAFTELGDYLAMPVRTYSAGMMLRLAFGVVTCLPPEILLMDEWLLTGDPHFLDKAHRRLEAFVSRSNILVLASNTEDIIREWCTKVIWLERGNIRQIGPTKEMLQSYAEAYQKAAV